MASSFSAEAFRRRVAEAGDTSRIGDDGDHRFNPGLRDLILQEGLRDAAVLVPVVDRGSEASVILTRRADALRSHSGQVAFPGGRIDPGDASPEAAALREAWEEIGLDPGFIEVIGRMPPYVSGSGFRIAPVIGIVRPGFDLRLNREEVDVAFEVPLGFLMDAANHARTSRLWNEREWFFYDMPYEGQRIWGVTAGIIRTLYERLYQ